MGRALRLATLGVPVGGGGGGDVIIETALTSLFLHDDGDGVTLVAVGSSGGGTREFSLLQGDGSQYVLFSLGGYAALSQDANANAIGAAVVGTWKAVTAATSGDVTKSGSWSAGIASGAAYTGFYIRSANSGDYIQYTTPNGCTQVGMFGLNAVSGGGYNRVTIDGDPTLATSLPTAQDEVTAGRLAASALVANGGTLNPTDRIFDQYLTAWPVVWPLIPFPYIEFANDLNSASHAVRVTATGYKQDASPTLRIYTSGFWSDGETARYTGLPWTSSQAIKSAGDTRWEFAVNFKPDGSEVWEWMGHLGFEKTTTAVIRVDGVPIDIAGTSPLLVTGQTITFEQTGYYVHPAGPDPVATFERTYTLTPTLGMRVDMHVTWVKSGVGTGYVPMMSFDSNFTRGSLDVATEDYTFGEDTEINHGNLPASAGYLWHPEGDAAGLCWIPNINESMNNYADAPTLKAFIKATRKFYATRVETTNIQAGTTWSSTFFYRIKLFEGGAEAALARPD